MFGSQIRLNGTVPDNKAVVVFYDPAPEPLVAGGSESSISIPIPFHEDALGQQALVYILEGYEGDEQRASIYRNNAQSSIRDLQAWMIRRSGLEAPNGRYGAAHFHTPPPLEIR